MSSYFDEASREVRRYSSHFVNDETFLEAVAEVEKRVADDVAMIAGDREFPDDLRQRIMQTIAVKGITNAVAGLPAELPVNQRARDYVATVRSSELLEVLHELFHTLARRRIETRFGILLDDPRGALRRRDEHDEGSS